MREERGFEAVSIFEVGSGKTPNRINDGLAEALLNLLGHVLYPLTLPLSGRLRDLAISADSTVACPIEGLVRRCRFFKGKHGRPLPRQQRSSHLRFTSHTCAQLQSKSRDDLQDGVKAGVGCCQALAGVLAPGIIERSTRHEALVRYKSSGRSEYRTENLAAYLFSAEVLICCPAVVNGDVSLVEVE
jgi:hypothetical protein